MRTSHVWTPVVDCSESAHTPYEFWYTSNTYRTTTYFWYFASVIILPTLKRNIIRFTTVDRCERVSSRAVNVYDVTSWCRSHKSLSTESPDKQTADRTRRLSRTRRHLMPGVTTTRCRDRVSSSLFIITKYHNNQLGMKNRRFANRFYPALATYENVIRYRVENENVSCEMAVKANENINCTHVVLHNRRFEIWQKTVWIRRLRENNKKKKNRKKRPPV